MIKIYSTENCHYCKQAKEYFESKGIDFESVDVGNDAIARQEMMDAGYSSVPILKINNETIVGWDQEKVELLLKEGV